MLKIVYTPLLLMLIGVYSALFAIGGQVVRLGENVRAEDIEIELRVGKNAYIKGEPIYFDILVINYGNSVIMTGPLTLGNGGYVFKNLTAGIFVRDHGSSVIISSTGLPPYLRGGTAERHIGALGASEINRLLPKTNTRYRVSVTKGFIINDKVVNIESNIVEITILPKSKIDVQLIAELSKLGDLNPQDNSAVGLFDVSPFAPRVFSSSSERYDSALTILRKHRNSVYFPYFVSYISRNYTPGLNPNFKGKNDDFLLDFLNNNEQEFSRADRNLSVRHMSRLGDRYLSRSEFGESHPLGDIGLKYKRRLSEQFPSESNERQRRRRGVTVPVVFYDVDVFVSPEKIRRPGTRSMPRPEN